jgi:hypothetical protein
MSGASSLASMSQQLAQALGVALAATALHLAMNGAQVATTIHVVTAFVAIGFVTSLALVFYLKLPSDAGAEVSGHRGGSLSSNQPPP